MGTFCPTGEKEDSKNYDSMPDSSDKDSADDKSEIEEERDVYLNQYIRYNI